MDIQEVFYYTATIAMMLVILFMIGMVILLFYVKQKISDLDRYMKYVIHKADHMVENVKNKVNVITNLPATFLGKSK